MQTISNEIKNLNTTQCRAQELLDNYIDFQKKEISNYHENHDALKSTIKNDIVQIREILDRQINSNSMVENLINDLLDIAQIENGKYKLHEDYFDLKSCIKETLNILIY